MLTVTVKIRNAISVRFGYNVSMPLRAFMT